MFYYYPNCMDEETELPRACINLPKATEQLKGQNQAKHTVSGQHSQPPAAAPLTLQSQSFNLIAQIIML